MMLVSFHVLDDMKGDDLAYSLDRVSHSGL